MRIRPGDTKPLDEKQRHRVMLFLKPTAKPGEIAHECKHAVNVIFSYRGVRLSLTNDEPECYFLDWMVTTVHKATGLLGLPI